MNLLKIRDEILKQGEVCDRCLGRQITLKFKGFPNEKIGAALRKSEKEKNIEKNLKKKIKISETKNCVLCEGIFSKIPGFEKKLRKEVKKYEFNNFLAGCKLPRTIFDKEEKIWAKIGMKYCEPIKREVNRIVGKKILEISEKKPEFLSPDLVFVLNFKTNTIEVQLNSLYLYGKYKKFIFIPQTKWPCRECGGRGCEKCKGTGKQYQETVEELIAQKILEKTKGRNSKFHGMGREDINARMLGSGRPFILEIEKPIKRFLDLKKMEKQINKYAKGKVEVTDLRLSSKKEIQYLKTIRCRKTYEILIECKDVTEEDLKKLALFFKEKEISQRTPIRVLHRRADRLRKRKIISTEVEKISENEFKAVIKTEAGTYVKELVNGDGERTKPSFASFLKKPCTCKALDVVDIEEIKK